MRTTRRMLLYFYKRVVKCINNIKYYARAILVLDYGGAMLIHYHSNRFTLTNTIILFPSVKAYHFLLPDTAMSHSRQVTFIH